MNIPKVDFNELRKLSQDEQILEMRRLLITYGPDVCDADSEEFEAFFMEHKERILEMSVNGELDEI